ncbi:MAG TPA: NAD(P)H-hydrate dehydratase, partial [Negativicutes bacterium]|nr:NAD(P)H-hydrate dehydratase [Negativicutes bacterium]
MQSDIDKYILGIAEEPCASLEAGDGGIRLTRLEDVQNVIRKRNRDSHKGTYGRVGFLSGSLGMAGAAVLNCNAALRSGSGLVKACITEAIYNVVEAMSIEAITWPFNEASIPLEELYRELINFSDVIATGSGCANMKKYDELLEFLLSETEKPLVIDAEGINRMDLLRLKKHKQTIVLTPHYGEMTRLLKKEPGYMREDIIQKTSEFACEYNVYLVLKGARTVVSCPDGRSLVNTTGNPGMATAGSGDVLTGVVASLAGQGITVPDALKSAVYVHGLAGDVGSSIIGEYSLVAGDIVRYLP